MKKMRRRDSVWEYYHYDENTDGGAKRNPAHDWSSHAADAWRYFAGRLQGAAQKRRDNQAACYRLR